MQTIKKAEPQPVIELYCGRTCDGQFFYAYIAIAPDKYLKYHAMIAMKKPVNLREFGEVIDCGFASKPAMPVAERMAMLGQRRDFVGHVTPVRRAG
jgi:hypothetical protein